LGEIIWRQNLIYNPSIEYEFLDPPIRLPKKESFISISHIKKSNLRPHIIENEGRSYYRVNEGNRMMPYEQLKQVFLRYEERINQINLL